MNRVCLILLVAVTHVFIGVAGADQTAVVKGKEVGQSMPLHVVHFVSGARQTGKGCPSVMISNRRIRGLEIWASSPSDQAFALIGELEPVLDADSWDQAFMIVGDQMAKEELTALAEKHGVNKTTVCVPNSKKLFQNAKFTKDHDLFVFFLDRKQIKARHNLKASELDSEARQEIIKEFERFLTAAR